jgi:hypothetical protein
MSANKLSMYSIAWAKAQNIKRAHKSHRKTTTEKSLSLSCK